ncbi:unnamed protein product [Linum trigynum]|uniref:Uncharacterized protein n=1 Tax=Linum trigynum TaxID=586398 RepID=A0AAV2GPA1_9ROSI
MRELGVDLFEPRTLMDSDFSRTRNSGSVLSSFFSKGVISDLDVFGFLPPGMLAVVEVIGQSAEQVLNLNVPDA